MPVNLLLVDDEPGILHAVRRLLHDDNYQIFEAGNGLEALAIIEKQSIDILITDYQMPRCDGITLCQKVREISPETYRLLLSGQVDYDILKQAWKRGDVHRFVAKPWDNLLLTLDVMEGLKQHQLLRHTHSMRHNLSNNQPVILLDNNWVVRLANSAFCQLLDCQESDLIGQNLFSANLSKVPVTQEAEVTRQVEDDKVWLGYFSFYTQQRNELASWLALSQLGQQFRLGVCQFVNHERVVQGDPDQQMQNYADGREPAVCISRKHAPRLMLIEYPENAVTSRAESGIAYSDLKSVCPEGCDIYHAPQPHVFLVLLPPKIDINQQQQLQLTIETNLAFGQHQLPPIVTIEDKPNDIEDWEHWLRQRLGQPVIEGTPNTKAINTDHFAINPIFDTHGDLVALESQQLGQLSADQWQLWFVELVTTWSTHFSTPLHLVIDATRFDKPTDLNFLPQLHQARQKLDIQCYVLMSEDALLSESSEMLLWQQELQQHRCKRILNHFGRNFLNARQIASLPIHGVSLAPEFLAGLQDSKSSLQSLRLLQKLTDQNILIYARNIDKTDVLATAHKAQTSWISGSVLSNELTFKELHWYSPESQIG